MLSCIDSRVPAEIIFDVGVGDIFSTRLAGNVVGTHALGSLEFACGIAGAKLVLVLGHTRCGAVTSAVEMKAKEAVFSAETGCEHVQHILDDIDGSIGDVNLKGFEQLPDEEQERIVDDVARRNVRDVVRSLSRRSPTLARLIDEGKIAIVGALYNVATRDLEILTPAPESKIDLSSQGELSASSQEK